MSKYSIDSTTLTSIGNAIRGKEGSSALIPVADFATRITNLPGGSSLEEGYIEFNYDNTQSGSSTVYKPYNLSLYHFLFLMVNLKGIKGTIKGTIGANQYIGEAVFPFVESFYLDRKLEDITPLLSSDVHFTAANMNLYSGNCGLCRMFAGCYNLDCSAFLAKFSPELQATMSTSTTVANSSTYAYDYFCGDTVTKTLIAPVLGVKSKSTGSNLFGSFLHDMPMCSRAYFLTNNGTPYTANWTKEYISIEQVGYENGEMASYILPNKYPGKRVTNTSTYAALKNDPDYWTSNINYSKFNHTSMVELINSLPDTSSYGGANTIMVSSASSYGSLTDGGAISNLTAAEIAVATAKGWTISLS